MMFMTLFSNTLKAMKAWYDATMLRLRRVWQTYTDYCRCHKAEVEAFNDLHYGTGSLYRWEHACAMTRRAKMVFHNALPAWVRPRSPSGPNDDLNDLLRRATKK